MIRRIGRGSGRGSCGRRSMLVFVFVRGLMACVCRGIVCLWAQNSSRGRSFWPPTMTSTLVADIPLRSTREPPSDCPDCSAATVCWRIQTELRRPPARPETCRR